jgi:hypothetical protein
MQYGDGAANKLWSIAAFPGAPGWAVIKTAPLELLAERAPNRDRMRLVDLCSSIGCMGFQLNVYDSSAAILVEVDRSGAVGISGMPYDMEGDPEDARFHEEPCDLMERCDLRFDKLPLTATEDFDDLAQRFARELGGSNAKYCDNETCVVTLVRHEPLHASNGIDLYFQK